MNSQFLRGLSIVCAMFLLTACQLVQPESSTGPTTAPYFDEHGFFTLRYPVNWIVEPYLFGDEMPMPHVAISSNKEINEMSMASELLPEGQIGVGIMLLPRSMFADAGLTAETPLEETARTILMGMGADDPEAVAAMVAQATFEEIVLTSGTPAVLVRSSAPTEAYVMTLSEPGDGLYLFTSQILALDYENAELEAQVMGIVNSVELTANADEIMGFIMGKMGGTETTSESVGEPIVIESGGEVPFYARFGEDETFSNGEHAVIIFYRPPECIPDDFNLNQFFHFPSDDDPGAFACGAPTTTGVETWQNGPDVDPAPLEALITGRGAVPVWFVAESELAEAMTDGTVTIGELEALPSLRTGTAATYNELLRPTQSNAAPLTQFSAEGTLESGERFSVDVSKGAGDVADHVTIAFGERAVAPTVTFTATEYAYDGPNSIPGGLTRIELVNAGEQEHMLWLAKLDEGKSFADIMEVFTTYETNPQNPDWLVWYGGISAGPGQSSAYTIDLAPGSYALFSMSQGEDGVPDAAKGMETTLTVTEAVANSAVPPVADLRTKMVDFSYIIEGTPTAGPQIVEVANTGMEAHEMILLKLAEGAALQDALDFMMAGEEAEGAPPFEFSGGAGPIHAGLTAWYEADLEAGEYGLICFIGSPDNDFAPHFALGMVRQVTVE